MKKFMTAAVAMAMAMSLVACGGSDKETASASTSNTDSKEGATFVIGNSGPLTGGAAVYGNAVKNGIQLAVDEINAAGGINGYPVKFVCEDDEADAEKAVNAYNTLKDQGMQVMVGTTTSGACLAVCAETANDNMFQITPSGTAVKITEPENVFRMCFSDPEQGTKAAQYISENKIAQKVGVIYDSSDPYSAGVYENFAATCKEYSLEIVAAEAFTSENKTDFKTQLQKMKDSGAELVLLPFYYTEASLVLKQAKEMNFAPIFFGCDGMDGILDLPDFDKSVAEGLYLLTPFSAESTEEPTASFVKNYQEKYNDIPIQFAAGAYDSVYVVKAAMEKAGVKPDMSVSEICDAMKAVMTEIQVDGVTGKGVTFTKEGEPNKQPMAVVVENGAYKLK
ncbi:MAG: ABC transporter substrate-binding protein [Eubacteriales bacterium]|nr:ABC transporter substrate-binding protein [Eubacteriales bacterium]